MCDGTHSLIDFLLSQTIMPTAFRSQSGLPTIRKLTSLTNTSCQEGVTAWRVADRIRSVQPTLWTLVGLRLLRYDVFFSESRLRNPRLTHPKRGERWPSAPPYSTLQTRSERICSEA